MEHQVAAFNLHILIGFLNQQIQSPHNATIEKFVLKMEGIRKNIEQRKPVIFNSVNLDILVLLRPMSNILQEINLPSPEFLTTCQMTVQNISGMCTLLNDKRENELDNKELFAWKEKFLSILKAEQAEIIPSRQTWLDTTVNPTNLHTLHYEYLLTGSIENALEEVIYEITKILEELEERFTQQYNPIVKDEFFLPTAKFLDTSSYVQLEFDYLFESVTIIQNCYREMLIANS